MQRIQVEQGSIFKAQTEKTVTSVYDRYNRRWPRTTEDTERSDNAIRESFTVLIVYSITVSSHQPADLQGRTAPVNLILTVDISN